MRPFGLAAPAPKPVRIDIHPYKCRTPASSGTHGFRVVDDCADAIVVTATIRPPSLSATRSPAALPLLRAVEPYNQTRGASGSLIAAADNAGVL